MRWWRSRPGAARRPTLDEIKDVLDLQRGGEQPCARVTALLDDHIAAIDRKLVDLRRLRRSLLGARYQRRLQRPSRGSGRRGLPDHRERTPPRRPSRSAAEPGSLVPGRAARGVRSAHCR
ncbi:MAG: MerR family DNA-binding protein [Actinomycetota bacterium]|nr:MerR family DNA-binding protein [Actinomycetota bacterium]